MYDLYNAVIVGLFLVGVLLMLVLTARIRDYKDQIRWQEKVIIDLNGRLRGYDLDMEGMERIVADLREENRTLQAERAMRHAENESNVGRALRSPVAQFGTLHQL